MKVSNIQNSNFYGIRAKYPQTSSAGGKNNAFINNRTLQSGADTVSFTGLIPFQKVSPIVHKEISELPVSKALQKQLVKFAGQADTFFAKAKIYMTDLINKDPDMPPELKDLGSAFVSLSGSVRRIFSGKGLSSEEMMNLLYKTRDAYTLINKVNAESGLDETNVERVAYKKLTDILDEIIGMAEGKSEVPKGYEIDLLKRITGIFKEIKAADPEGVREFAKEISAVKLPFWKK